jgi:hypothetical protein
MAITVLGKLKPKWEGKFRRVVGNQNERKINCDGDFMDRTLCFAA